MILFSEIVELELIMKLSQKELEDKFFSLYEQKLWHESDLQ